MSRESDYIPVSELANADHPSLAWRVSLPEYAPSDQILVNVKRLSKLAVKENNAEEIKLRNMKHSIMPILPLDRFAVLSVLSRTQSLAKPRT